MRRGVGLAFLLESRYPSLKEQHFHSTNLMGKLAGRMVAVITLATVVSCASSAPTAPGSAPAPAILPLGPSYALNLTEDGLSSGCFAPTDDGSRLNTFLVTLTTLAWSGSEWVATASPTVGGDVEMRFHQSGLADNSGNLPVAGTIKGTAIHDPEHLGGIPPYSAQMTFGANSTFTGTITPPKTGLNVDPFPLTEGKGSGSVTLSESGVVCGGTSFSFLFFSVQ